MESASWKLTGMASKGNTQTWTSLTEVDWGGKIEANHTSGFMLSEVDWRAHESSLFLYLEQIDHTGEPHQSSLFLYLEKIDHNGKPQDFFTSGLWEEYYMENFQPHNYGQHHPKETFSNLKSLC